MITIPFWPLMGGLLIGSSAVLLMLLMGRIAGISGIIWNACFANKEERLWRAMFIVGILLGTFIFHAMSGRAYPPIVDNIPLAALAGLLVGIGVNLGSGCTSGHGVCGISRLSTRSIVATIIFMVIAMITVALIKPW